MVDGVTTSNKTLTYDGAGNLIDDGEFTYTWQMGKQLQGITGTGLNTSYKYNENGLRTEKTVNGQTHEYTLLGSSVTREVIRDSQGNILWTIHYSYAGDSTPVSMNVNGTEYYYLKNGQGDITHIVDGDGNEVASYEYDAWGNHLSVTGGDIAELNLLGIGVTGMTVRRGCITCRAGIITRSGDGLLMRIVLSA